MNRRNFLRRSAGTLAAIMTGGALHPLAKQKPKRQPLPKVRRGKMVFDAGDRKIEMRWTMIMKDPNQLIKDLKPGDFKLELSANELSKG